MHTDNIQQNEERVKRLTESLDFFSQVLSVEQLTLYGFTFLQGILSLQEAALYMKKGEEGYELCNHTCKEVTTTLYRDHGRLNSIATLLGRALWHDFGLYFDHEFVQEWEMGIVIPIIIQDKLMGFIVSKGIRPEATSLVDVPFVENIKNIMNMAFYMAVTFEKGKDLENEINKRIFNLFFINQSTKVLLSELNIDHLYQLCIDVVRELTSSSMTSFCLYDEIRERIIVKSFNDIVTFKKCYVEFKMKTRIPKTGQMVYDVQADRQALSELIENMDDLQALGAKYVILLVKDDVIGFVTLGEPVNNVPYDHAVLSQIESLASSIYISLTNAMFIRQIQTQTETIEQQLKAIQNLNRTVKNINSCQSIEEISEITLATLEVSFGVRTAFVASKISEGQFQVVKALGADHLVGQQFSDDEINERCRCGFYFDYDDDGAKNNLPQRLYDGLENKGCCVVSPLKLDMLELSGCGVMGYIVILATDRGLKQEELYSVETISNLIAPIFRHMQICSELESRLKPDDRAAFFETLKQRLTDKEEYEIDFRVYYKKLEQRPFESPDLSEYQPYSRFVFDGYLYVIARQDDWVDIKLFDSCYEGQMAESLMRFVEGDATA